MSKSKSRQPSRPASTASRSGSRGGARSTVTTSQKLEPVVTEETSESTLQDAVASTQTEVAAEKESVDVAAGAQKATSAKEAKTVPATTGKGSVATKTAPKAVPSTPRPVPVTPVAVSGKAQTRDAAKYERRQLERQQRYLAQRRRVRNRIITVVSVILAVAVIGVIVWAAVRSNNTANKPAAQGSYQEPIYNTSYPPVDSVYCDQLEGSVEHIHALVSIYINGQTSAVPQYVGIPQDSSGNASCYYWLHTHDSTGIIHIESPVNEVFTFGQFRDEWDQQFQSLGFPPELLLNTGWKIWVNGKVYNGSLSSVPLAAHNIVTLAYNSPNVKPVTTYNWGSL